MSSLNMIIIDSGGSVSGLLSVTHGGAEVFSSAIDMLAAFPSQNAATLSAAVTNVLVANKAVAIALPLVAAVALIYVAPGASVVDASAIDATINGVSKKLSATVISADYIEPTGFTSAQVVNELTVALATGISAALAEKL